MPGRDHYIQIAENRLLSGVTERDVLEFDAAAIDRRRHRVGKIDDLVRLDDDVNAVGDVADVLEKLEKTPTQIARLVDDQQRGRDGGAHARAPYAV